MSLSSRSRRIVSSTRTKRSFPVLAAGAIAPIFAATSSLLGASGTWSNPAAVTTTLTPSGALVTSTTATKDGDVWRFTGGADTLGLQFGRMYYITTAGSTPVASPTAVRLAGAPGALGNVSITGPISTLQKYLAWGDASNWNGGNLPNGSSDIATINNVSNTRGIAIDKNITINELKVGDGTASLSQDVSLVTTINTNAGPYGILNFAGASPKITYNNGGSGKYLFISEAQTAAAADTAVINGNARLVIGGSNGLTIDNQNTLGTLPYATGGSTALNASPGAVKFGFNIDWSKFSGTLTLARGAFASVANGTQYAFPMNSEIVLGDGSGDARWETFKQTNTTIRGLSSNDSNSSVLNTSNTSGGAITFGSYSTSSDTYTYAGQIGGDDAPTYGPNAASLRILKIGAGTQVFTGKLTMLTNLNQVIAGGGKLSLGSTGSVNIPGQPAGVSTGTLVMHNGEFDISGNADDVRSQSFGPLQQTNGTSAGTSFSNQSNGLATITAEADPTQPLTLTFGSLALRNLSATGATNNGNANGLTAMFRGSNLGQASGAGVSNIMFTTAPTVATNGYLVATGTGTAGTTQVAVLKGALAKDTVSGATTFATYDSTNGVRLLVNDIPNSIFEQNIVTNSAGYNAAATTENVNLSTASNQLITGKKTNTLQINNTGTGSLLITTQGTALYPANGLLFSGGGNITLQSLTGVTSTADLLTGTAATDNEDVVIHSINTGTVTIATPVSNIGIANRPGWITYSGTGNFKLTGTQTVGSSGGIAFNSTGTGTTIEGIVVSATNLAINQGKVKLATGAAFNTTKPNVVIAPGATLDLGGQSGSAIVFDALNNNALPANAGIVAAAGTVTNTGAAVPLILAGNTAGVFPGSITGDISLVIAKNPGAAQTLTGPNSFTGNITVTANATGNPAQLIIGRYGTLPTNKSLTLGGTATNTAAVAGSLGTLVLGDAAVHGAVEVQFSSINVGGTGGVGNTIVGNGSAFSTLIVNNSSDNTFDGRLGSIGSSPGSANNLILKKIGAGKLTLTQQNGYAGGTTIGGGTLSVAADNALGYLVVVGNATQLFPATPITNSLVIDNATFQTTAGFTLNNLRGVGIGQLTGSAASTATIETVGASNALVYNGAIASAGTTGKTSLVKSGAGTLNLGGANTYGGDTTLSAGTLLDNGSILTSKLDAAASTKLGGSGSINLVSSTPATSAVTLTGATLSPGNSIGTLTVNSNVAGANGVVFGANSTYLAELSATEPFVADLLRITGASGNLSLATTSDTLNLLTSGPTTSYTISTFTGSLTGIFDSVTLNGGAPLAGTFTSDGLGGGTWQSTAYDTIEVIYTNSAGATPGSIVVMVPEPTTVGLMGLGALGILSRRRNRKNG